MIKTHIMFESEAEKKMVFDLVWRMKEAIDACYRANDPALTMTVQGGDDAAIMHIVDMVTTVPIDVQAAVPAAEKERTRML